MLFMGEEWATRQPFMFFSDVGEDLADAIRHSRKEELKEIPVPQGTQPPDPMARSTFEACKLDWEAVGQETSSRALTLYRRLIALRQKEIVPRLGGTIGHSGQYEILGPKAVQVCWTLGDGSELSLVCNLSNEPLVGIDIWGADHLWLEGFATGNTLDAWSAVFRLKPRA
jgi:1,4-alpha-glucan branching enzyme